MHNLSTNIFSVEYHWEEGISINFRENKTFRVENTHLLGGDLNYGKFNLKDSVIILLDKIKFGESYMKDTLTVEKDGVSFTLENPWSGLKEATMIYQYSSETKFPITNYTNNHIDSINIKMSYSDKIKNYQSLNPGQTDEYKFNLKNPYINGKYILTFYEKNSRIENKEFRKFTNGYPLEAVKKINIHNDKIITELIFGTLITTELNN